MDRQHLSQALFPPTLRRSKATQRGLTLVELMVTLVVAAILVGLAAPAFTDIIERYRVEGVEGTLTGTMNYARSEAIRRNLRVTLCPRSASAMSCVEAQDWSHGWLVFIDDDDDDQWDSADGEELLRVHDGVSDQASVGWNLPNRQAFDFLADGRTTGASTLLICSPDKSVRRAVVIAPSGRARNPDKDEIEDEAEAKRYGAGACP